jgi:hypothetical protein
MNCFKHTIDRNAGPVTASWDLFLCMRTSRDIGLYRMSGSLVVKIVGALRVGHSVSVVGSPMECPILQREQNSDGGLCLDIFGL